MGTPQADFKQQIDDMVDLMCDRIVETPGFDELTLNIADRIHGTSDGSSTHERLMTVTYHAIQSDIISRAAANLCYLRGFEYDNEDNEG